MKYYIVDDDANIIKLLTNILEENSLGEVVGTACDGETALRDIWIEFPDIILIELLIPKLDVISLIKEVKAKKHNTNFVMISQVSDVKLITEAYKAGIEFFISKPINYVEIESVLRKLREKIRMEQILANIRSVINQVETPKDMAKDKIKELKKTLSMLGMLGEKGTTDIIYICTYLIDTKQTFDEYCLNQICSQTNENVKTVKQRIRRAIKNGLTNLANAGVEDLYSTNFQNFSNTLFDFEDVKAEMDYIRGKRKTGGKVNINKFIECLMLISESQS